MRSEEPAARAKVTWRHLILLPLAAAFLSVGISNARHGPDWSGWLVLALGLGALVAFGVLEVRGRT
jgi:hypothetical protein